MSRRAADVHPQAASPCAAAAAPATAPVGRCSATRTCTSSTRGPTAGCTKSSARTSCPAAGVYFAVWAPNAQYVVGHRRLQRLGQGPPPAAARAARPASGKASSPRPREGSHYKYHVASRFNGYTVDKVDPFGFMHGTAAGQGVDRPQARLHWADADWMAARGGRQKLGPADEHLRDAPRLVDARVPEEENRCAHLPRAGPEAGRLPDRPRRSRTSSSCRSWSTRSTARGATRRPATSPPPAGSARRRT